MILEHEWLNRSKHNRKPIWKGFLVKSPVTGHIIATFRSLKEAKDYVARIKKCPRRSWMLPGDCEG